MHAEPGRATQGLYEQIKAGSLSETDASSMQPGSSKRLPVPATPLLGRARELGELERLLILSTKLGGWPDPCDPQNTDHLRHSVEESRGLLRRDTIDIFMIDEPDRPGQHDWWSDWDAFNGPVLAVLVGASGLRLAGVI